MARKTKEEAALTRQHLLEAAREVFAERGVARTSLEQVAKEAGVTRGCVYWHFKNKAELFYAMRDQVALPIIDTIEEPALAEAREDPLEGIANFLKGVFGRMAEDEPTRRTFEVISLKCEYVDEFAQVLEEIMRRVHELVPKLAAAYRRAQAKGQLAAGSDPELLALDTSAFFHGLVRLWLTDTEGRFVRGRLEVMIDAHVQLRRAVR